ncbi:uncharacterized protein LOC142645393 [Dermatophagoides pteronyssinus]|uniref:uncharacterized protein LOC142645393 n=1 Tax=Dermatophagoides pteronyssinus TaxID=6956 RepID=UPI003F672A5F
MMMMMMAKQNNNIIIINNNNFYHHHRQQQHHHHHCHRNNHHQINQFTIKNLFIYSLIIIVLNLFIININATKFKLCHQSPRLRFYDIASHLAEQTQLNNTTTTTSSSSSTSQSLPNPKYFRSLFSNQDNITNDNDNKHHHVTVIALSSLHDERANTDAWINNLEHIYNNLVEQKSFHNIRLILINLKDSYNPIWVNRIRKKVSFEVYQELPSSPISNLLDGHSGDVYIFDRCNLLAYYIRFPLSFIDRKDPFFQATILAAHTDSPCKEKCVNRNLTPNNITDNQNETMAVTEISSSTTTTLTPVVDNVDSIENNQTDTSTNELNELNVFSQMGQVLKIFYNRYTMNFEPEIESSSGDSSSTTVMPNITTNLIDTLNRTLETYGLQKSQQNISIDDSTIKSKNVTTKTGNGELRSTLSQPPKFKNGSKLSEVCQQTNCTEWSTERLLAARLCCLSITTEDDDEPMVNVNATVFIPSNGGFGCKLYPRTTCSMIKPVLRCCTRKLVNQYFTYAIQLRERQRQQFGPGQRSVRSNSNNEMIIMKKLIPITINSRQTK